MQFNIKKRDTRDVKTQYPETEFQIAKDFSRRLYNELGDFIKAVVLFGSATGSGRKTVNDIDILVIVDDVKMQFTEDLVQTYRVITQKIIADTDPQKLHVQSMKFSAFWEYVRSGDPVATNVLRYGIALIDTGFFDPLQSLLDQGRIRPTPESIATYFALAPKSIESSDRHMLNATVELYWAVINAAHAALMHYGEVPPSPDHVAEIMKRTLIRDKKITVTSVKTMEDMYKIFKGITHRKIGGISGKEYDSYRIKVDKFVKEMDKFIRTSRKK
jgi:predicted nucleotidyltransferase